MKNSRNYFLDALVLILSTYPMIMVPVPEEELEERSENAVNSEAVQQSEEKGRKADLIDNMRRSKAIQELRDRRQAQERLLSLKYGHGLNDLKYNKYSIKSAIRSSIAYPK